MDETHMRFRARVSTSHRVYSITIPKDIGDEMGLKPGDIVESYVRVLTPNGPARLREE